MGRDRGMTKLEIIVIVAAVLLLAFLVLPAFMGTGEPSRRTACMNNVRQIGLAMFQYAQDHEDRFMPLVDAQGNEVPAVDNVTGVSSLPSRSAFAVLLKEGYLTTAKVFICTRSSDRVNPNMPADHKNTPLASLVLPDEHCSYGWDPTKYHSACNMCAIVADKPPLDVSKGGDGSAEHNSPNHKDDGQNVFYNDGHVKWGPDPRPDSGDDPDIYTGAPGYERSTTDAKIVR